MSHKYVQKEELVISDSKLVKDSTHLLLKIGHQICQILFVNQDNLVDISKQLVKEYIKMSQMLTTYFKIHLITLK